jgi:hypothetical protein
MRMNTRMLMGMAAAVLAVGGLAGTFAPQEMLAALGVAPAPSALVLGAQALGAAWLGFALLDWHARGAPFGGIYGRPIALGNFLHFVVLGLAVAKAAFATPSAALVGAAVLACGLALAFGRVLFGPAPPAN